MVVVAGLDTWLVLTDELEEDSTPVELVAGTGSVSLSLYRGNIAITGRQSAYSLYNTDLAAFTMGDSYDQKDAAGFIRILGLPARSRATRTQPPQQTKIKFAVNPVHPHEAKPASLGTPAEVAK